VNKFIISYGTRPELHKLWPLIVQLRRNGAQVYVVCTGQHSTLLRLSEDALGIHPDVNFWSMSPDQTLIESAGRLLMKAAEWATPAYGEPGGPLPERFDAWIVQGDTTSALTMAIAGRYAGLPVVHVEAGLRSFDDLNPFPEEINRRAISALATMHFAPTPGAAANLRNEGVPEDRIWVVGNTELDATSMALDLQPGSRFPQTEGQKYVVVTAHRRESIGMGLREITKAIIQLAEMHADTPFYFLLHPNPEVAASMTGELQGAPENLLKIAPLDFVSMTHLLAGAHLVATDSGGLQESCPFLGVPVIVLRDVTERPEGVEVGLAILGGRSRKTILPAFEALFGDTPLRTKAECAINPYGEGDSAERIARELLGISRASTGGGR